MNSRIVVENTNGNIAASIDYSGQIKVYSLTEFDIRTIIGDFIAIRNVEYIGQKKKITYNLKEHIFFRMPTSAKDYEYGEYYSLCLEDVKSTFRFMKQYRKKINNKSNPSEYRDVFEKMICYYGIDFQPKDLIYNTVDIDDFLATQPRHFQTEYSCPKISSRVAAVLHYYMMNDYKLVKCKHCGLYFATLTLKTKYCPRMSKYVDKYSQKSRTQTNCEQTVRDAKQQLSRKRLWIEKEITNSIVHQLGNHALYSKFNHECESHLSRLKQAHSIDNLTAYNEFLESIKQSKGWEQE